MKMKYRYTRNQVARGTRADAVRSSTMFLLKNVSSLRLTYQIRLLTLQAQETGRNLVIRTPQTCKLHSTLRQFQSEHSKIVRIEKV